MTVTEVETALESALKRLGRVETVGNSYRRESKLDPRFGHMGIGKRRDQKLDPYNFSFGLGKRQFEDDRGEVAPSPDGPGFFLAPVLQYQSRDLVHMPDIHARADQLPGNKVKIFTDKLRQLILQHVIHKRRAMVKSKNFIEDEVRKLQERRKKYSH